MLEKEGPDSPLLDLSDVAVKELTRGAKKRGYVTHDPVTRWYPQRRSSPSRIEDILAQLVFSDPWHRVEQDHTLQACKLIKGKSAGLAA